MPLGDENFPLFSFPRAVRGIRVGGMLVPHVWPELEDEVRWQSLSGQWLQCGSYSDQLVCLSMPPPSIFTCPRLLWLGWDNVRVSAQRI